MIDEERVRTIRERAEGCAPAYFHLCRDQVIANAQVVLCELVEEIAEWWRTDGTQRVKVDQAIADFRRRFLGPPSAEDVAREDADKWPKTGLDAKDIARSTVLALRASGLLKEDAP